MNEQLKSEQLEICLQAYEAGASLDACINLFPDNKNEIAQLIKIAAATSSLVTIPDPAHAKMRNQTRIVNEIKRLQRSKPNKKIYSFPQIAFAAIVVVTILILGTSGLFYVFAQPLPDNQSNSIKRVFENLREQLIPSQEQIQSEGIYKYYSNREIQEMFDKGKIETVSFSGEIEEINTDFLIINDILVKQHNRLPLSIELASGDLVRVFGESSKNGWILAQNIIIEEKEVHGLIQSLTSDQIEISGTTFIVPDGSVVDKRAKVGDSVAVLFESSLDGTLYLRGLIKINSQ